MKVSIKRSTTAAALVAAAALVWILSGTIVTGGSTQAPGNAAAESAVLAPEPRRPSRRVRVSVFESQASTRLRRIEVSAQTEPNRSVLLRAEAEGRVIELGAERGAPVTAGADIARLDLRDRAARQARAEALVAQYELQHRAAEKLRSQSLLSEAQIAEARSRLVSARADAAQIELELVNTRIRAPFDGVIQEREVEVGDFVRIGDTVATLVDTDPLIVSANVTADEIGSLALGQEAAAVIAGQMLLGTIRYVAPVASLATRTFRVELAVPNPTGKLRGGMSAELTFAADSAHGHLVPPSALTLDDSGAIGLKIVDPEDRAVFVPVAMLSSGTEGVWVKGLPETARIIAVGQGFVTDGEIVEPIIERAANPPRQP